MACATSIAHENRVLSLLLSLIRRLMAVLLLVAVSPLVLTALLLIWVESGGNVIFKQKRIGKAKYPFIVYKLRTMASKPSEKDALFPDKDAFVTPLGKVLRVLKIDELPQLINVIKGQMGFLGPRPLREKLHCYYMAHIPGFGARYQVLPGITGLSQLMDPEDTDRHFGLACDLYYIHHRSFRLNLAILGFTVLHILSSILKNACRIAKQSFRKRLFEGFPKPCSIQQTEPVFSLTRNENE